jgi:hypothetical protein
MRALMTEMPRLISGLLEHAAVVHGNRELVSCPAEEPLHRPCYAQGRRPCPMPGEGAAAARFGRPGTRCTECSPRTRSLAQMARARRPPLLHLRARRSAMTPFIPQRTETLSLPRRHGQAKSATLPERHHR